LAAAAALLDKQLLHQAQAAVAIYEPLARALLAQLTLRLQVEAALPAIL
jgi:hypothetical protein